MPIEAAVLDELRAKYGTILRLKTGTHEAIFRAIDRVRYKKFNRLIADPAKREDALDALVRDCLIYPDGPAFEAMLAEKPFHAARFAEGLLKEAGAEDEAEKNE
jgi:hypothetical protein